MAVESVEFGPASFGKWPRLKPLLPKLNPPGGGPHPAAGEDEDEDEKGSNAGENGSGGQLAAGGMAGDTGVAVVLEELKLHADSDRSRRRERCWWGWMSLLVLLLLLLILPLRESWSS
jgi:hypothetical protein